MENYKFDSIKELTFSEFIDFAHCLIIKSDSVCRSQSDFQTDEKIKDSMFLLNELLDKYCLLFSVKSFNYWIDILSVNVNSFSNLYHQLKKLVNSDKIKDKTDILENPIILSENAFLIGKQYFYIVFETSDVFCQELEEKRNRVKNDLLKRIYNIIFQIEKEKFLGFFDVRKIVKKKSQEHQFDLTFLL